jgi:hypothetical protein
VKPSKSLFFLLLIFANVLELSSMYRLATGLTRIRPRYSQVTKAKEPKEPAESKDMVLLNQLQDLKVNLESLKKNLKQHEKTEEELVPQTTIGEAWKKSTKQNYRYYDETAIRESRKILVFGYGSLMKQKKSLTNLNKLKAGNFIKTNIEVPLSLTRISGQGTNNRRVTVVIDNESDETGNLWAAFSKFQFLPNARNNLAAREGAPLKNTESPLDGYDLSNIFYIKKLLSQQTKDPNEQEIQGMPGWVVRVGVQDKRQELPQPLLKEMAQFAERNGADAAIWASFPSNKTVEEIKNALRTDERLAKNTYYYLRTLPLQKLKFEKYFGKSNPKELEKRIHEIFHSS